MRFELARGIENIGAARVRKMRNNLVGVVSIILGWVR